MQNHSTPTEAIDRPSFTDSALGALRSVSVRVWVRAGFLAFFLTSVWQLWRYYEWALGYGSYVARPEATAGLVPLGALMSLAAWIKTGQFDPVMPASVVIVIAAILVSVLLKRGFCGYLCPVGTITATFGWVGRRLRGGKALPIPQVVDRGLRVPKYLLGAYMIGMLAMLPAEVALEFQQLPYYATSDLKILYGLLHPAWGYWALAGFVAATSLLVGTNTWCRYLCPLGAVYGGLSVASLSTVERNPDVCITCGACDRACAARIDVSKSRSAIRSPECDGCQDCVTACPATGAMQVRVGRAVVPWQSWAVLLVVVWLFIWALALATGHWEQGLPDHLIAEYMRTMKLTHDF